MPGMLDVPFAFSSNGDGFAEYDALTGREREFALAEFPTEEELIARYEREVSGGAGLTELGAEILAQHLIIPARTPMRRAIINGSRSIVHWMRLHAGSSGFCS